MYLKSLLSFFFALFIYSGFSFSTEGKEIGTIHLSKEKPQPGEQLTVRYLNDSVTIENSYYYYLTKNDFYIADLEFNDQQETNIVIPDSSVAIVIAPKVNGEFDTNEGDGYFIPLYDENGNQLAYSETALTIFAQMGGRRIGLSRDFGETFSTLHKQLEENPKLIENNAFRKNIIGIANAANTEESAAYVQKVVDEQKSREIKNENDIDELIFVHKVLKNTEAIDSLKQVARDQFPKGKYATASAVDSILAESNLDNQVSKLKELNTQFDVTEEDLQQVYVTLAEKYAKNGDYDSAVEYVNKLNNKLNQSLLLNSFAWDLAEQNTRQSFAEKLSSRSLQLIDELTSDENNRPAYFSMKDYVKILDSYVAMYNDTFAKIRYQQGDLTDALQYQEMALEKDPNSKELEQTYIKYILEDGRYEEVIERSRELIEEENFTEETVAAYRTAYNETYPEKGDFDQLLDSLTQANYLTSRKQIEDEIVSKEAPNFTLKNLDGETVSLTDFAGKIVILDFWATWCAPCKMSFPGMQEMVDKYNDEVVFLFIDTFEGGDDRNEKVQEFITSNNYNFHVLLDEKQGEGFKAASKYGVEGIPVKYFIGPDGKLRYEKTGFAGTDKLKEEIDIVIELIENES